MPDVEAVIFDWGGTLTRVARRRLPRRVAGARAGGRRRRRRARRTPTAPLHAAGDAVWGRCRDHQQSATVADLFAEAGLDHDPDAARRPTASSGSRTPTPTPTCVPLFEPAARSTGIKVGVLSNTIWPREWHEEFFERDGVLDLIDGDVYTSEIPWTKPAPEAFRAAMEAVGVERPGALRVRRRPALRRHLGRRTTPACGRSTCRTATSRATQVGHTEGEPDAVAAAARRHVYDVVSAWRAGRLEVRPQSSAAPGNASALAAERTAPDRGVGQRVDRPRRSAREVLADDAGA